MSTFTNGELRPLGWAPGKHKRWCAGCSEDFHGGPKTFKCRPCASKQLNEVNRICRNAGIEFDDAGN